MSSQTNLLSDPFLQLPDRNSVRVVWFTEFAGKEHTVTYGENLDRTAIARTTPLTRTREDSKSEIGRQAGDGTVFSQPTVRSIWRHEAEVTEVSATVPYYVTSTTEDGAIVRSDEFTLSATPAPGKPLKILLTSDHQLKPMTAANLQKVEETVGKVDAVFLAGDLVDIPDRASEWFDDRRGSAFFPALQGRADYPLEKSDRTTRYRGGALIQFAPLFPAIGNHEVMGRFSHSDDLNSQFSDAVPTWAAAKHLTNAGVDLQQHPEKLKDASFNSDTYEEIFSLPNDELYYAVTFGDIRLVVLYVTNIWRPPGPNRRGRYQEDSETLQQPEKWGYGQHIFEPISEYSDQYNWLMEELNSPEFAAAKYKVVMFHHPPHTLGGNGMPAYTDPIQAVDRDPQGEIQAIRYEYPRRNDYLIRDVVPLLEAAGVQLVYYGHSHLWNRFRGSGINFLESSNVGNTYGAHVRGNPRPIPPGVDENRDYVALGDPNGLEAIVPNIAPLTDDRDRPLPYLASNDITAFSILDTGTGTVSSYRFDTRSPDSEVVKFDEFPLISKLVKSP
ncbi:MAG: metallophosphoesterase [Cyanobacteriota bacterium]|nr:metallophosphoesterase [Cyanobacteriota bacterium]